MDQDSREDRGSEAAAGGDAQGARSPRGRIAVVCVLFLAAALGLVALSARRSPRHGDKPDVILIVIDALRADHVSCYGYGRKTTPTLDAFAEEAILCLNNKAPSGVTTISMTALFKSRYTVKSGLGRPESAEDLVFAEVFEREGYRTVGVQTNPWLASPRQFTRGFADYYALTPFKYVVNLKANQYHDDVTENIFYVDGAAATNACEREIAAARGKPLFLYVHLMEPHGPYIAPEEYQTFGENVFGLTEAAELTGRWVKTARSKEREKCADMIEDVVALYDAETLFADACLARIFEALKKRGSYEDAVIVITSDHGEGFLEHGKVLHANSLYGELLRTVLVMKIPGLAPRRYDGLTRNIDIAPTVFAALGIDPRWGDRDGASLLAALEGKTAIVESAARMQVTMGEGQGRFDSLQYGRFKYIASETPHFSWREELYDLEADPGETTNLAGSHGDTVKLLAARLAAKRGASEKQEEIKIDPQTELQLKALGYL